MKYLLDTCVLSEIINPAPSPEVGSWVKARDADDLFTSAVVAGELRYGIERLTSGRKRVLLEEWFEATVAAGLAGRILPLDYHVALSWGALRAKYPNAKIADAQIAATALVHGLTLATRNVRDFAFDGLAVFNPWEG
jgi:hypothetical protein